MKAINAPTQTTVPFANSGTKNAIPVPSQQGTTPGAASMTDGFPPLTMQPIASGGIPPFGADMNGILNQLSTQVQWAQAGGQYPFNATFAASIGGYPAGALVLNAAGTGQWLNTVDQNSTNPDASGAAGWVAVRANTGVASITATSGNVTPTSAQLAAQVISVTGTLSANAAVVLPLSAGATWIIANNTTGSFTLAVNGATGAGVTVPQGNAIGVYTDGTNFYATSASVTGQYLPINGTAVAATKLATARSFTLTGPVTAAGQSFDGTGNVTLSTAIADGALTIAKTNGLQTALDGKFSTGGGTITGSVTTTGSITANGGMSADNGATVASSTAALSVQGGGLGRTLLMLPNITAGSYNPLTATGDVALIYGNANNSGQSMTIAPWVGVKGGIRLNGNGQITDGLSFSGIGSSNSDLSHGISLYGSVMGFGITSSRLNYVVGSSNNHVFIIGGSDVVTISGSGLTCSGTGNFLGSDLRLKTVHGRVQPRPLHRELDLYDFTLKDNGERSKGLVAQEVRKVAHGDYVGEFDHKDGKRLSVNYAGAATEMALWAANEVDRIQAGRRAERWVVGALALVWLLSKVL